MNIKKNNIEIYYDNNIDNLNNFSFFTKWLNDNREKLNILIKNNYNKVNDIYQKYSNLHPLDLIRQLGTLKFRIVDINIPIPPTEERKIQMLNKKSILYYKLINRSSLRFWEINQRYNLIQKHYKNLYEINSNEAISECIVLLNDKYFPLKRLHINYSNMPFLCLNNTSNKLFDDSIKIHSNNYRNIIFHNNINFDDYEKYLDKITNIDFIYLSFYPKSTLLDTIILFNIARMFELYTFLKIINKINIGGSICIYLNQLRTYNHLKLMSFYCYFFESYYVTHPEINNNETVNGTYLILKNKKDIEFDPTELLNKLLENSPSLGINNKLFRPKIQLKHDETMTKITKKEYFENFDEKIISKINIINPDIENIYNDFEKEYITMFNSVSLGFEKNLNRFKDLFTQQENGTLTEEKTKEIIKQNIEECKNWARKYNMTLVPEHNIGHFDFSYENIMYRDVVSFEKDIYFKFKSYKSIKPDIKFTTPDGFYDLPIFFEKMIGKAREDIRAFDYRNIYIYESIKHKIDYYYKKLTYAISLSYVLPSIYVRDDEWLKVAEILSKIKVIDKTKTNLKSFHICELSGSFINAISFFIDFNNYNIVWSWKAQAINTKSKIIYNDKLITNELDKFNLNNFDIYDENLLNIYHNNYDYGNDNTGDITKYENLQYYRKHHNDYDLVTAGCGSCNNDEKDILSYAQYLMIFSCCKKGGNAIIKRIFPIENTQELNMLYLFYLLFESVIAYKPKLNYHSQEYYLVGLNYKGIDEKLLNKLIDFINDYKLIGFMSDIPSSFTLQIDKMQNELIENMNKFIKKQIYFCDNFENITKDDWQVLKTGIREKIKDWFNDLSI